ncbi:uncharacterized protein LOC120173756 [Hibiscus syriacus]|uniref:uncharacterized protein LOC120173756 n=1 Tax=Hibiscus syriacus TaxID=106335 RepID=UPI001921BF64|nr:uncharacterized protein LOC120173756 [Hibiscus syriacus]
MADGPDVPTCVLKVNIQCCSTCPEKVKKKLQKINDVYDIDIDSKNGLVSVRGTVQPSVLIQTISEKVGKKAELYSYVKNLDIQSQLPDDRSRRFPRNHQENNRTYCFTDESIVDTDVKDPVSEGSKGTFSWHNPQHGVRKKKHGFARWFDKKSNIEPPRMFSKFGGLRLGKYVRLRPAPSPSAPSLPP